MRSEIPPRTRVARVEQYRALLEDFLDLKLNATDFEYYFFQMWDEDLDAWNDAPCDSIDHLFFDVDAYRPESQGDPWRIDEAGLRRCVERALNSIDD